MPETTERNEFLTLLSAARRPQPGPSLMHQYSPVTDDAGFAQMSSNNAEQLGDDEHHFGSKPRIRGIEIDPIEARALAPETSRNELKPEAAERAVEPQVASITDTESDIDALIHGMNKHVVLRDLAVTEAKTLDLPRGYTVDSEITPSDFYRTRKDIRKHTKRKRQDLVIQKSSRQKWEDASGFKPYEVNYSGAVYLEECRASNLDNGIHPLLQRSRFDDTPDAIYDQFIPALRLATMFLTQPVCMQFWVTVALGKRCDDSEMSNKYGRKCQRIANHVEMTKENTRRVIAHLKDLGESNIIHFAFRHKLLQEIGGAWGSSGPICEYLGVGRMYGPKGPLTRSIIRLHADHYIIAKKLSQLKYPELSQTLRFNFFFANLIMHELAHSIEGAYIKMRHEQWTEYQRSKTYVEPFWLDWQRPPECGKAWEQTMFGGEIQPINNRVDGSHGIGTSDWPPHGSGLDPERRTWYTVPMTHIEKLFQKSTWHRPYSLKDWRTFHIPRTGAISLYINCFTTMPWSEGRRVAHEEIRDLIATVTEQPPPKIRMISSGAKEEHRPDDDAVVEQAVTEQEHKPEDSLQRKKIPIFPRTRPLSSVTSGALTSSRDTTKNDTPAAFTVQQLCRFAECLATSSPRRMTSEVPTGQQQPAQALEEDSSRKIGPAEGQDELVSI